MNKLRRAIFGVIIISSFFFVTQFIWEYFTRYGISMQPLVQKMVDWRELIGPAIKAALITAGAALTMVLLLWSKVDT